MFARALRGARTATDPVLAEAERIRYVIPRRKDRERQTTEGPAVRAVMEAVTQSPRVRDRG